MATGGTLAFVDGSPFGAVRSLGVVTIEMGTSPFVAGMQFDGMTGARSSVFAANDATLAIAAFKVQAAGALVAAEGSPFAVAADTGNTQNVFCDQKGTFVYVPDFGSNPIRIFGFRVRKKDAALFRIKGSPFDLEIGSVSAPAMRESSSLYAFGPASRGEGDIHYMRKTTTGARFRVFHWISGLTIAWAGGVDQSGRVPVVVGDYPGGPQAVSWRIGKKGRLESVGMVPLTGAVANRLNAVVFATP